MSQYLPTIESETLLIYTLIPNILSSIIVNTDEEKTNYSNIIINKTQYGENLIWEVRSDIEITRNLDKDDINNTVTKSYKYVHIVSLPRLTDNGYFLLDKRIYYTVLREKLLPNNMICRKRNQNSSIKSSDYEDEDITKFVNKDIKNKTSINCICRVSNFITMESREIRISRSHKKDKLTMIYDKTVGLKKPIIEFITKELVSTSIISELLDSMKVSNNVKNVILCEINKSISRSSISNTIFPCNKTKKDTLLGEFTNHIMDISLDVINILLMWVKYIKIELDEEKEDDIDDYKNKGVEDYGILLGLIIRHHTKNITMAKCDNNINSIFSNTTTVILEALRENKWEVVKNCNSELKLSRFQEDISPESVAKYLHEIVVPNSDNSSLVSDKFNLRHIHLSQKYFVCMCKTSDDTKAGLRQYIASDCVISRKYILTIIIPDVLKYIVRNKNYIPDVETFNEIIYSILLTRQDSFNDISLLKTLYNMYNISDNKEYIIWMHNFIPVMFEDKTTILELLQILKQGLVGDNKELSFSVIDNVIYSRLYYGRYMCKITYRENNINFNILVDSNEIKQYKDKIIESPSKFSLSINEIPFKENMPPARTNLSSKNLSNAVTISSHEDNIYSNKNNLLYIQKPLVISDKSNVMLNGENAVILFATYEGYGNQDGIVINKSSVERGLFSIIQKFKILWENEKTKYSIDYISEHVTIGSMIKKDDLLITIKVKDRITQMFYDINIKSEFMFQCRIEEISKLLDNNNNIINIVITLSRLYQPEVGCKFSSRFGQKAVSTILVNVQDMPFSDDDRLPHFDMIIDPNSIMSRNTISQCLSMSASISLMLLGGSVFKQKNEKTSSVEYNTKEICKVHNYISKNYKEYFTLYKNTMDFNDIHRKSDSKLYYDIDHRAMENLKVMLYNGKTGEPISGYVVTGMDYYYILPHIPDIKIKPGKSVAGNKSSVRYNWQELFALLHHGDLPTIHKVYVEDNNIVNVTYCQNCSKIYPNISKICKICYKDIHDFIISIPKNVVKLDIILKLIGSRLKLYIDNNK